MLRLTPPPRLTNRGAIFISTAKRTVAPLRSDITMTPAGRYKYTCSGTSLSPYPYKRYQLRIHIHRKFVTKYSRLDHGHEAKQHRLDHILYVHCRLEGFQTSLNLNRTPNSILLGVNGRYFLRAQAQRYTLFGQFDPDYTRYMSPGDSHRRVERSCS